MTQTFYDEPSMHHADRMWTPAVADDSADWLLVRWHDDDYPDCCIPALSDRRIQGDCLGVGLPGF
jgi:hypothetical protein